MQQTTRVMWSTNNTRIAFETETVECVYHSAVVFGKKLYFFSGAGDGDFIDRIYILDPMRKEWDYVEATGELPKRRTANSATVINDSVFILGGMHKGKILSSFERFDLVLGEWFNIELSGSSPGPCNGHSAEFIAEKNSMIVFNGYDGHAYKNETSLLNLETLTWRKLLSKGKLPPPRSHHASTIFCGNLFIFGGFGGAIGPLNDLYILKMSHTGNWWSQPNLSGSVPSPRFSSSLVCIKDRIILFGGEFFGDNTIEANLEDLFILLPNKNRWLSRTTEKPLPVESNSGHTLAHSMGHLIVIGPSISFRCYYSLQLSNELPD